MLNVIKTVGIFFKYSPKKQVLLEECVESFNRGALEKGIETIYLRKVKLLCDTRRIERHTSFLVALNCAQFLFGLTSNVAKSLQSQTMDVMKVHTGIKLSITELRNVRSNAEKEFDSIFIKVVEMANDCGTTIQIKRRCQQQTNRGNYEGEPKDFYRNSIFIPYLDNVISQLESRFHQINLSSMHTLHLLLKNLDSLTREFQTDIFIYYGEELQNTDCFEQEVRLWKYFWSQSEELPSTPDDCI